MSIGRGSRGRSNHRRYRVNEEIRAREVQVVDETGKRIGIMKLRDALALAYSKDLDLVEVSPGANPPVVKIMDYGKFLYEEKKKQRASKRPNQEVKEITLRPTISKHDLEVKMRKAREFLGEGHKVLFRMRFRGREVVHSEMAKELLLSLAQELEDLATLEREPVLDGRFMHMLLRPKKR